MPVFDFNNTPEGSKDPVCTYKVFYSNVSEASAENPILILDNRAAALKHHSSGIFTNPIRKTAFEFKGECGYPSDRRPFRKSVEMAGREPYQCAALRSSAGGRIRRIQDP